MNPNIQYTFGSAKGIEVTITSRMGEEAARSKAMEHLWGPPRGWCLNKGEGLHLINKQEREGQR